MKTLALTRAVASHRRLSHKKKL